MKAEAIVRLNYSASQNNGLIVSHADTCNSAAHILFAHINSLRLPEGRLLFNSGFILEQVLSRASAVVR